MKKNNYLQGNFAITLTDLSSPGLYIWQLCYRLSRQKSLSEIKFQALFYNLKCSSFVILFYFVNLNHKVLSISRMCGGAILAGFIPRSKGSSQLSAADLWPTSADFWPNSHFAKPNNSSSSSQNGSKHLKRFQSCTGKYLTRFSFFFPRLISRIRLRNLYKQVISKRKSVEMQSGSGRTCTGEYGRGHGANGQPRSGTREKVFGFGLVHSTQLKKQPGRTIEKPA